MSGASGRRSTENRPSASPGPGDAEDEEAAEADGEQDDARLVARPRQAEHRMAQREHALRAAAGRRGRRAPATKSAVGDAEKPAETITPDPQRGGLPGARGRRTAQDDDRRHPLHQSSCAQSRPPSDVRCPDSSRSSHSGRTRRTSSSGTSANSSDTSDADGDGLQRGLQRQASAASSRPTSPAGTAQADAPSTRPSRLPAGRAPAPAAT